MSYKTFTVGFQNVQRGIPNADVILEEGFRREWDVVFLAEPWVNRRPSGWATTMHDEYNMVSTLGQDTRLVAYVNKRYRGQEVEKKEESPDWCVLKVRGQTTAGVYMRKKWTVQECGVVVDNLGSYWRRGGRALLLGDWNAHHQLWGRNLAINDGKGKVIKEQLESKGGKWLGIVGEGTWRRPRLGRVQESIIDLAWQGPEDDWQITERFWTTSDHKAISFRNSIEPVGSVNS